MAQAAKILLVEDDTNLGEIYHARMAAEGYTVISARDGEEALALAAKEKPDLIISDVMMPKISGFEMLDILRNTEGLKDTKVIMLTALGQAEDRKRADSLGADRYLVKSQVTLEDIVKSAQDLLGNMGAPTPAAAAAPLPVQPAAPVQPIAVTMAPPLAPSPPSAVPLAAQPSTATAPPAPPTVTPMTTTAPPPAQSLAQENADVQNQVTSFAQQSVPVTTSVAPPRPAAPTAVNDASSNDKLLVDAVNNLLLNTPQARAMTQAPAKAPAPVSPPAPSPAIPTPPVQLQPASTPKPEETIAESPMDASKTLADSAPVAHKKVIKPIDSLPTPPDLNSLLAAEEAKNPKPVVDTNGYQIPDLATPVHQPGNVFTPASKSGDDSNGSGIDPNNIAL